MARLLYPTVGAKLIDGAPPVDRYTVTDWTRVCFDPPASDLDADDDAAWDRLFAASAPMLSAMADDALAWYRSSRSRLDEVNP